MSRSTLRIASSDILRLVLKASTVFLNAATPGWFGSDSGRITGGVLLSQWR